MLFGTRGYGVVIPYPSQPQSAGGAHPSARPAQVFLRFVPVSWGRGSGMRVTEVTWCMLRSMNSKIIGVRKLAEYKLIHVP